MRDPDAELRSQLRSELRVEQRPLTDYDTALGIDLDSTADTADTGANPNTNGEVAS